MTPLSSATLAVQILQQPLAAGGTPLGASADALSAAVTGKATQTSGTKASPQTVDALFSAMSPNINKMKMDLEKRVGEALGVNESDYDTQAAYGAALRKVVGQIKLQPNSEQVIAGLEKSLGLDKLGVSLDSVINAIIDPKSDDAKKLDDALKKQVGEDQKPKSRANAAIASDDIGIYARA